MVGGREMQQTGGASLNSQLGWYNSREGGASVQLEESGPYCGFL